MTLRAKTPRQQAWCPTCERAGHAPSACSGRHPTTLRDLQRGAYWAWADRTGPLPPLGEGCLPSRCPGVHQHWVLTTLAALASRGIVPRETDDGWSGSSHPGLDALLARGGVVVDAIVRPGYTGDAIAIAVVAVPCGGRRAWRRAVDRAVAVHGPTALAADVWPDPHAAANRPTGESRPKGTDEVAPQSGDPSEDAAMHGGDGNSGECDSPAETKSSESRDSGPDSDAPSGAPDGSPGSGERSPPAAPSSGDIGDREPHAGEETSEDRSPTDGTDPSAQDELGRDAPVVDGCADDAPDGTSARAGIGESTSPYPRRDQASGSEAAAGSPQADSAAEVPAGPLDSPGGESGERSGPASGESQAACQSGQGGWNMPSPAAMAGYLCEARRSGQDVVRALLRLILAQDLGGTDETPRLDGRRLVREIVSRRCAIGRAMRCEATTPIVVLACDVSGSCSAAVPGTVAACVAVSGALRTRGVDCLVIAHSNGYLGGYSILAGPVPPASGQTGAAGEFALARVVLSLHRPVACVVAFGDWDAASQYQTLSEAGAALYWLDSYGAKDGARPASQKIRAQTKKWERQPAGMWAGVNTARTAAIALRAMRRGS